MSLTFLVDGRDMSQSDVPEEIRKHLEWCPSCNSPEVCMEMTTQTLRREEIRIWCDRCGHSVVDELCETFGQMISRWCNVHSAIDVRGHYKAVQERDFSE